MFRRTLESLRRWLLPAALLALVPKCVLCALAYAGLAAAVGLGGPEFCGGPSAPGEPWPLLLSGLALSLVALGFRACWRRRPLP